MAGAREEAGVDSDVAGRPRRDRRADRKVAAGASEDAPEAVAAITIGEPAEELDRLLRDLHTVT